MLFAFLMTGMTLGSAATSFDFENDEFGFWMTIAGVIALVCSIIYASIVYKLIFKK